MQKKRGGPPVKHPISVGDRFDRWLVVDPSDRSAIACRCDCGTERAVRAPNLYMGLSRSCGCINLEEAGQRLGQINRKHGLGGTPIYACWKHAMRRCHNPKSDEYPGYGGRGITVHGPWHDPAVFAAEVQAEIGPLIPGMTLDRINNDASYAPGNIRWETRAGQARNRRSAWITRRSGEGAPIAIPEQRNRSKLSQDQVVEILQLVASGKSQTATAAEFEISQGHVSRIIRAARKAAASG